MADTVKKSRIVSESECLFADSLTEDSSLQDIINEEFNQRLKSCMTDAPIEPNAEHIALTYETGEIVLKNGDVTRVPITTTSPDLTSGLNGNSNYNENGHQSYDQVDEAHYDQNQTQCSFKSDEFSLNTTQKTPDHHQISDHHQIASDLSADSEHIESLSSQASSTPETQKERVFTTPQQQFECVVTTPDDQVTCISPDSHIFDCDPNLPQIEISESKDSETTDLDIENEQISTASDQSQTYPDLITEQNKNEQNINTSGQISQNPQSITELDQHQIDLVQVRTDPDPGSQNFELQSILNQNQIDLDIKQIDLDQNQIDLDHIQNHLDKNQIDLDQSQPNPNQQLNSPTQLDPLKSGLHTEFSDPPDQILTNPALENEVIKSPDAEKSPETETSEQSYLNKEIPSPESDIESPFDNVTVTDVDSENLNAKERFLSMVADLDPSKSTSKDRMFLSTDSACILFTQTVVQSPMLTPTDENYDFLQGLRQTADATGTAENSEMLPDAKPVIDCEDVSEISAENEVCRQIESSSSENDLSDAPKPVIPPPNPEAIQTITASFIAHESSAQLEFEPVCNAKEVPDTPETKKSESFGDIIENTPMKSEAFLLKKSDWSPNKIDEISKIFSSVEKETVKSTSPLTETFENIQKTKEIFERLSLSPEHESYAPKSCDLIKKFEENSPSSEEFDVTNSFECREGLSTTITSESSFVETRTESNSGQEKILKKKKSKKSKKDNEKENISVCDINIDEENLSHVSVKNLCRSFSDLTSIESKTCDAKLKTRITYGRAKSMSDIRKDDINMRDKVFSNVSVKALRQCFDNLTNRNTNNCFEKNHLQPVKPSKKIQLLKSSFSKFDALQKKSVLQTRAADSGKTEKQNGATPQGDTSSCKTCAKQVFQMEQIKAEKCIWHKNCFRCQECNKQLTLDTYQSNDGDIYCKPHFKALFTPKAVEDDQPTRPRKHEMIIRENQPEELPPDVIRASDKPDLGLDELQNLNVKERFQVFEHHENIENSLERTPSAVNVKRSPSILSKLAKFQQRGMDIGVGDDSLNGVPVEESSSEEENEEDDIVEGEDADLIRAKRAQREKPLHFNNMSDIMNKWETGNSMTKEERREERKQELQSIRNRIFMGKQGRMKEMYQQAVAESESGANVKKSILDTEHCEGAKSLKDKFEKGEALTNDEQEMVHELEEDKSVFESGISKKSRSIFLELDANASKAPQMTPVSPVKPGVEVRRAREAFMARQAAEDVVKASDQYEDVTVKTADITNRFKFFETFKEPEKQRKVFRITPPRDGQDKLSSPERDVYRDPEVVRGEEYVDDSEVVQKSHTATKMLSIFRQMEENLAKDPTPAGPKPLKRFTPPPEPTREESESGDEESDEEEEDDESDHEDKAKLVDDDLLEAQKAARAKQLRAKFEKWEANELQREQSSVNIAEEMTDGDSQIESAKSLRARFESMREVSSDKERAPRVKVNRFVDTTNNVEMCKSCEGRVYPLEKVSCHNNVYHKNCFRCRECNTILRMDSFTYNQGLLFCVPHFKRLFIAKGNYESGFGLDQHKEKWNAVA